MKNKYHHHNLKSIATIVGVMLVICFTVIFVSGDHYKQYLGLTEYPNCMKLNEYGDEGNEEGVRFQTTTLTPDYQDVYALAFESYYMTSSDTASQKYDKLSQEFPKENILTMDEQMISSTVKVKSIINKDDKVYFIVQDDSTVFKAYGEHEEMDKKQKWFDVLKIHYQIPQSL